MCVFRYNCFSFLDPILQYNIVFISYTNSCFESLRWINYISHCNMLSFFSFRRSIKSRSVCCGKMAFSALLPGCLSDANFVYLYCGQDYSTSLPSHVLVSHLLSHRSDSLNPLFLSSLLQTADINTIVILTAQPSILPV